MEHPLHPPAAWFLNGALLLLMTGIACAADWPPTLDSKNPVTQSVTGRPIERYTHGPREAWGYPPETKGEWGYPEAKETGASQQNHSSFYLVAPKQPRDDAPLCVVLHSANRTAYDYLGFGCLDRKIDGGDDPATTMTNAPEDFYALYLSSTNAEWWGWSEARKNAANHVNKAPPAELRVLDTIEWVVNKLHIDRNRIYLCGVSMGGCGTLGIGMPNGKVFAAIRADVPAGTGYASYRRAGFAPSPAWDASPEERDAWVKRAAGVGLPDPPVVVDFSSQIDAWSVTQPALVQASVAGHLPLVLTWGPFGHTTFGSSIAKTALCRVGLAYPWLDIRKNEAYPVFTRATSDQESPWLNAPAESAGSGQMNAYFRWKNVKDTADGFALQLWIAHPQVSDPPGMPDTATADVSLRRLQQFKIEPGRTYAWQLSRDGRPEAAGRAGCDLTGLLTIPRVALTTAAVELSVRP